MASARLLRDRAATRRRAALSGGAWSIGASLACIGLSVLGAQTGATFDVRAQVAARGEGGSAFCRVGPGTAGPGPTVVVICATGAVVDIEPSVIAPSGPVNSAVYRFERVGDVLPPGFIAPVGVELYSGLGTVASWRVVNSLGSDYVELLLNW